MLLKRNVILFKLNGNYVTLIQLFQFKSLGIFISCSLLRRKEIKNCFVVPWAMIKTHWFSHLKTVS